MIRENTILKKLNNNELVIGTFVKYNDASAIEILGLCGFDFFVIDAEHVLYDPNSITGLLQASDISGIVPIVRVRENRAVEILQALDAGALGTLVPQVNTVESAKSAADSSKYPPTGKRGYAPTHRAAGYGLMNVDEYVQKANRNILLGCYCETLECVNVLDEILEVEGIDLMFIGPNDLAASMGFIGQPNHPEVLLIIDEVISKVVKSGKTAGTIASNVEEAMEWISKGCRFITISSDQGMMSKMAKDIVNDFKTAISSGR